MTHPVLQAITERRTTNLFDPARDIAVTQIGELVHLATRAPTSFNLQNWRFIAVHERASKVRLRKLAWDQAKVVDAAVTFIVCGQLADERTLPLRLQPVVDAGIMPAEMVPGWEGAARSLYNGQPQRQRDEAIRSATLGAATLMHAAQAMGLGSAPMIGFDAGAVASEFNLAVYEIPVMLVAVGYALPENWPQKPRRPLDEVLELA
ncbi:nitroreductase family protein [Pseudoduganella lutea]|uniref:Nitroreductase family protein n=2 Tax=Pseudoduganella lutea TaxID=321985 RepID=A0A4P6L6N7_9BURK|nr:nitroreductase family protein [Pseudoduganella lutea]QBE67379.1 nitroreductase family protein [Pseudoduganella lutea]